MSRRQVVQALVRLDEAVRAERMDKWFPIVVNMDKADFLSDTPPGFAYWPSAGHYAGQRGREVIRLGPDFFSLPRGARRLGLLYHELGHDLTLKLRFNEWWLDVMRPFQDPRDNRIFDNPYGISTHPSEVLADAYSMMVTHNADEWFDDQKYKRLMARIKKAARHLGLPLRAVKV